MSLCSKLKDFTRMSLQKNCMRLVRVKMWRLFISCVSTKLFPQSGFHFSLFICKTETIHLRFVVG